MPGRVIETLFINDDADVSQVAEEDKCAECELLVFPRRFKRRPIGTRRTPLEIDADVLKSTPHQT